MEIISSPHKIVGRIKGAGAQLSSVGTNAGLCVSTLSTPTLPHAVLVAPVLLPGGPCAYLCHSPPARRHAF